MLRYLRIDGSCRANLYGFADRAKNWMPEGTSCMHSTTERGVCKEGGCVVKRACSLPPLSPPSPSPPPPSPPPPSPVAGTTHAVSGGDFSSPYYNFSPALPGSLSAGATYTFNAAGISGTHPFRVGTARGSTPAWVTGSTSGMTGSSGTIAVAVPSDYTGSVVYYCNPHSSMTFTMSVTGGEAVASPPPPSLPPPSPPPSLPPPSPPLPSPPPPSPPPPSPPVVIFDGGEFRRRSRF